MIQVHWGLVDEQAAAIYALGCYAKSCGSHFTPYIQTTLHHAEEQTGTRSFSPIVSIVSAHQWWGHC